ncbi:TRAP transporter small permease [Acuticoccus mangrovi]|uniref:TRAP transporter small permease protein n=1 Tax=Acuticoccus mangrovi TaxID=2796142 RepID=A0A934IJ57_9HYPH|nr:TRAP transporter small permease [Acuticoccus mangrovi]MBJ3777438.1 TRAP transporter small permease [Acuticoccus mangrovi]
MIAFIDRIGALLARAFLFVAAVALFALVPMAGWLVFGRYVLNRSPTWVEATSLVLMLVVTFGVAAAATRSEEHLSIAFVRESFPPPVERVMRFVCHVVLAGFGAWMALASYENTVNTWSRPIPLLQIPEGVRHLPLLVGGFGIAVFSAIHALKMLVGLPRTTPSGSDGDPAV